METRNARGDEEEKRAGWRSARASMIAAKTRAHERTSQTRTPARAALLVLKASEMEGWRVGERELQGEVEEIKQMRREMGREGKGRKKRRAQKRK
jgi:hypothetical protein